MNSARKMTIATLRMIVSLMVLIFPSHTLAQQGTWVEKASLLTGRTAPQAEAVGGALYAIGGVTGGCPESLALPTEAYDPTTNEWSAKAPLPPPPGNGGQRAGFATAVVDGKIYAFGGGNCLIFFDDVQVYDPTTDSWSVRGPMPTARAGGVAAAVNGKIYLIAGYSNPADAASSFAPTLQYDPSTDTWTTKAAMPTPRLSPGAAVIGGKIYVVGGGSVTTSVPLNTLEAYDPATDMWTTLAPMSTGRSALAVGNVNGLLYAFGGNNSSFAIVASGEVYAPASNMWSEAPPLPAARGAAGAAVLGGVLYVIGGQSATAIFATNFAFTPTPTVPFAALTPKVEITLGPLADDDAFEVKATFILGGGSNGIAPLTEDVSLHVGTFSTTIPAGSFQFQPAKPGKNGKPGKPAQFTFEGLIAGVLLEAKITALGGTTFEFKAEGQGANLSGTVNPVTVGLTIGDDGGSTTVTAEFE